MSSRKQSGLYKQLGRINSTDTGGEVAEFTAGERVIWYRSLSPMPWIERVSAVVVRVTAQRVRIRFEVKGTGTPADGQVLERSVQPHHLEKFGGDEG